MGAQLPQKMKGEITDFKKCVLGNREISRILKRSPHAVDKFEINSSKKSRGRSKNYMFVK